MSKTFVIAISELKQFFLTPLAYIILFWFYTINGVLFWFLINQANTPSETVHASIMKNITGGIIFWLIQFILIPAISMRLFALESERKTLSLLMLSPLSSLKICLGKFLGGLFFYLTIWMPTLLYVLILNYYTSVDLGPVFSSYLGLFLVGTMSLSMGLFCSIICRYQISAAIATFGLLLTPILLSMFETILPQNLLAKTFGYFNYIAHYGILTDGIIDTRSLLFFVTTTILFFYFSVELVSIKRRDID